MNIIDRYILYKIIDLTSNKFYIGATSKVEDFIKCKYNGTGGNWIKYYNKYKSIHTFKRKILASYNDKQSLYKAEKDEILKYCIIQNNKVIVDKSTGCMNEKVAIQGITTICKECGSLKSSHKKSCSQYKEPTPCDECKSIYSHLKTCSKYKQTINCPECGGKRGHHKKDCSLAIICDECHGTSGNHKSSCSKCSICKECGGKNGRHLTICSQYTSPKECEYCHKKGHARHKEWCIHYKKIESCPECKGRNGVHYSWCSKFKTLKACPECNGKNGHHFKRCSKYKDKKIIKENKQ